MSTPATDLTDALAKLGVPETALHLRMVRSSGPGGQNVNKVSTAIQLSCDVQACDLSDPAKARLKTLAGRRMNNDGVLSLTAQRLRTQEQNRRDALERLLELIAQAHIVPKLRRATKPTQASRMRRLEGKQQRSQHKQLRRKVSSHDD
ncbi:MAG: alternative ribosome rescue aminoacyl-tRNA hydrolase ArfB [Steroidobacteraceae bacterium]